MDERAREGIIGKLDRAREHLKRLNDEVEAFVESKPHAYWAKPDFHAGRYGIYVTVNKSPSVEMSVTCGDFIHCLRSSLDQLVSSAVGRQTKWSSFPIYDDRDDFLCRVVIPARRKRPGQLTGLDPEGDLFTTIEALQPYNGGHGPRSHPLYNIAMLSNMDKHRAIVTSATAQTGDTDGLPIRVKHVRPSQAQYQTGVPLKSGAKVAWGTLTVFGAEPEMEVEGEFPFEVAFGEGADFVQKESTSSERPSMTS
ncbi:MAG TPA: hypothetical protein VGO29_02155 [Solirubrobacteraceae bacterium]|nr:hypothetical protein [Solirubrobacteraceae bacterium]